MKSRVLQNARFTSTTEQRLAEEFDVHPLWTESDPGKFLGQHGREFVALATSGGVGADARLIKALPSLKLIASRGVGFDKIDLDACRRHRVAVCNTPGVLNDCVAELACGALIYVARDLCRADRFVCRGDWMRGRFPLSSRVSGKRLGILRLGRIGRTVARRASGFDMEVRYHNRQPVADVLYDYQPSPVELA
jgi:hydroxypyruvate reductase